MARILLGILIHLCRRSIRHPPTTVILGVLIVAAAAPGILRLRLRTDGHALIPEGTSTVLLDRAVRNEFGIRDPLVVLLRARHRNGIFHPRTLRLVVDLTAALARTPGLDSAGVRSLATEPSDHFRQGTLSYRNLLDSIPETPREFEALRGDIDASGVGTGTLVSFDYRATAILVGMPPAADRATVIAAVEDAVAGADTTGHEVSVIGAPVAEALLGSHILEDLGVPWQALGHRPERADRTDEEPGGFSRLRLAIARHVGLLPLSIVIMALVFLACFRSLAAVFLPLAEVGACLVVVFGLMGWTGVPVYLTIAVLPIILVSMGLADEIHIFSRYAQRRALRPAEPIAEAVGATMEEMTLPVAATALTTAVGFLAFAVSPLAPVRAFGLFTALGVVFCMLWSLTVIPALLVLIAPPGFHAPGGTSAPAAAGWRGLASRIGRRPALALGAAALALAMTPFGIGRLVVQDGWISGFARDSAFYRATRYFNDHFFGTHVLLLVLDAGHVERRGLIPARDMDYHRFRLPPDLVTDPEMLVGGSLVVTLPTKPGSPSPTPGRPSLPSSWSSIVESAVRDSGRIVVTTPRHHGSALFLLAPAPGDTLGYAIASQRLAVPGVLQRVDSLERFVREQGRYSVGGALGPADQVAAAEFIVERRLPESRRIPDDVERVRWLWSQIGRVRGHERLREVVDSTLGRALVTVFLKEANFVDTAHLMDAIRRYSRERLEPAHIRLDVAVSQTLIEAVVTSQMRSILFSLLGILAVTGLLFRSLRWGVFCTLPAALAVAATFAGMGWLGMPLGVATSMFAGMVLGIGVDFAIHLTQRYRLAVEHGAQQEAAILESLSVTGPAIMVNALALALGFGILVLSQVPANARLGAVTVLSLLTCLAATLLVLPALLRVSRPGAASAAASIPAAGGSEG